MHKAGFVNIIGYPNVGKSTLMNVLLGESLVITSPKAQTTRHRIFGILNGDNYQIVFSDTPGIIKPDYPLQDSMMKFVNDSFKDADLVLVIGEPNQKEMEDTIINKINSIKIPVLTLINKIDLSNKNGVEKEIERWKKTIPNGNTLPISALNKFNTDLVLNKILELLPESPPYFPKDELTDKPKRFFVSEIIRQKILLYYKQEIPYAAEVVVQSFKNEDEILKIEAVINVERESQKGIVIGHKGVALTKLGTQSRRELENFFRKKVYLNLFVKVEKNWRKNLKQLKRFGYNN